jgi:hypothetical protein
MTLRGPILSAFLAFLVVAGPAAGQGTGERSGSAASAANKETAPAVRMLVDAKDGKTAEVCVSPEERAASVTKVELSVDGTQVAPRPRDAARNETGEECPSTSWAFDVELVPGTNRLEAIAYTSGGAASVPARDSVRGASPVAGTTLHVLAIGIDAYATPTMRLSFARNDARAFADSLAKQSRSLFENVIVDTLFDGDATESAIKMKFAEIAERVKPEDTFVFFYAGHGAVGSFGGTEGVFYLVPVNVRDLTDGKMLAMTALPAATLQQYLAWIPARSKLIILDACNSGAMVEFYNGKNAVASAVLGTMNRESETGILAATQPSQPAGESSVAGHGLFTAALLQHDGRPGDRVSVQKIRDIAYEASRVLPILIKRYGALEQEPRMVPPPRDFPLIVR